jgi:hypothetical protein
MRFDEMVIDTPSQTYGNVFVDDQLATDGHSFTTWECDILSGNGAPYSIWVQDAEGNLHWAYIGGAYYSNDNIVIVYDVQQPDSLLDTGWNGGGPVLGPGNGNIATYYIRGSVSEWIEDIIGADSEFLSIGHIGTNLAQVSRRVGVPTRCWDAISEVVELGDTDGNPWHFWVDTDRKCYYEQVDTSPRYWLRGGQLYDGRGGGMGTSPWLVRPGVVRDAEYVVSRQEYSGWLTDQRDMWVQEVEVADGDTMPKLRTGLVDEAELLSEQHAYQQAMPIPGE